MDEDSPLDGRFCEVEIEHFFKNLLPGMQKLALKLPELVTKPLPYLKGGQSISLTHMQIASILANAFFCTFPPRNRTYHSLPDINFKGYVFIIISKYLFNDNLLWLRLFCLPRGDTSHAECNMEKLKCIFTYFRRILTDSKYKRHLFFDSMMITLCSQL